MANNKICLDTSILIELQKGSKKIIDELKQIEDSAAISRITACEFIYGARNKHEKKVNKEFLTGLHIFEVTEEVSKYTYTLLDKYGLGTKLSVADALIAATSVINKLPLWTLNKKHFSEIKELKLL
jgi:predicted nucleic acid-binding protein